QGAEGDARPPGSGPEAIEAAGALVAQRVAETLERARDAEDRLGLTEVEIGLPPAEPQGLRSLLLRRPAANVVEWLRPSRAPRPAGAPGGLPPLRGPGGAAEPAGARPRGPPPPAPLRGPPARVPGPRPGLRALVG